MPTVIITRITGRFQPEPERHEHLSLIAASCLAEQVEQQFTNEHGCVEVARYNRGHEVETLLVAGPVSLRIVTQYQPAPTFERPAPVVHGLTPEQRDAQSRREAVELWG